jgi:hypothetical protein
MRHHGVSISDANDEELLSSSLHTASSDIDNMYLALPESYDNNEGDDVIHSIEFTSWMRVQLQGHLRSDESTVGGSQSSSGSTVHRSVDLPLRRPPPSFKPESGDLDLVKDRKGDFFLCWIRARVRVWSEDRMRTAMVLVLLLMATRTDTGERI